MAPSRMRDPAPLLDHQTSYLPIHRPSDRFSRLPFHGPSRSQRGRSTRSEPVFLRVLGLGAIAAVGFLGGFAGCVAKGPEIGAPLKIQLSAEPVTLDPAKAEDGISYRILNNTMDGLYGNDAAGRVEPRLAESHEVSSDGKRWRIRIRGDARWSDGKPVVAEDFVYAFRRALERRVASKMASLLFEVRGARAFHQGTTGPDGLGVKEASGSQGRVLEIELEKPITYFLGVLTMSMTFPQRRDVVEKSGGVWPDRAPATGPYVITERRLDHSIRLEPNPFWVRPSGRPSPLPVVLQVVQDESTASRLFETGHLDVMTRVPSFDREKLAREGKVQTDRYFATYFLGFNTRKPPFDRPATRKAIASVIRRDEIVRVLGSGEVAATGWIPPGLEGHEHWRNPSEVFPDAATQPEAKQLKGLRVRAGFDAGGRNSVIMEKIQSDLKSKLGLEIELSNVDWKTHVRNLGTDPAPLFRFGIQVPFADPIFMLEAMTTRDPNNYTGWGSAQYDAWVERIRVTRPGAERERLIRQAQRILTDEAAVVIPIYHYVQLHAVSPKLKGFKANPFGMIRFSDLWRSE